MFLTYAHYTPQGRLFYIGKGSSERRPYYFKNRNVYWNNIVQKHGTPEVEILAHWNTEKEALKHETFLIKCFRKMGYILANLTDGGEGSSGRKCSEETRMKKSLQTKGRAGKKPSQETLEKLRTSHLGQVPWNKGQKGLVKQTQESIKKRVLKLIGHTFNLKYKYIGTSIQTGEVVNLIGNPDMIQAGFDPARIRDCANGTRKTHKKFVWRKESIEGKQCSF